MHLSTAFATFFSLSVFSLASAQVYHPTISPTPSNFKTDLVSRLPPANVGGMSNWPEGWIPEACYREAVSRGFSPWNVEVRNVTYADCDRVWAVCRVYSASVDWNSIVQTLGRIPVGMRQYAGNALIVPDANTGGCATVADGYIVITTAGCWTTDVLLHELTHILDRWALQDVMVQNGYTRDETAYSQSRMWSEAYDNDSHVVTDYARTGGQHENFAEVAVFGTSDRLTPGGVEVYIGSDKELVDDQIANWRLTMEPHIWTSTGRCTAAKKDSTNAVSKSNGLRRRGEKQEKSKSPFVYPACGITA